MDTRDDNVGHVDHAAVGTGVSGRRVSVAGALHSRDRDAASVLGEPARGQAGVQAARQRGSEREATTAVSDLVGPLRYLIGADELRPRGEDGYVTECGYDVVAAPKLGTGIKYGNLFNEKYKDQSAAMRARYAPYMHTSDTAEEYGEGQIDPRGQGWNKNLDEQIERAKLQGFRYIEWDNPDAYRVDNVIGAVDRAWGAGLQVIAKNPLLVEGDNTSYLAHPAVVGCVVEQGCGTSNAMEWLRRAAYKPLLPVWFVCFGAKGKTWAEDRADVIREHEFLHMGVTWSSEGEYENSVDILQPTTIR